MLRLEHTKLPVRYLPVLHNVSTGTAQFQIIWKYSKLILNNAPRNKVLVRANFCCESPLCFQFVAVSDFCITLWYYVKYNFHGFTGWLRWISTILQLFSHLLHTNAFEQLPRPGLLLNLHYCTGLQNIIDIYLFFLLTNQYYKTRFMHNTRNIKLL